MKQSEEQSKLRKYILNDLDSDERLVIDERLLADDDYFEEVLIAEESLIQDYADDSLTGDDRERFKKHFLTSEENRRKVKFARALRKHVNESESQAEAEKKRGFFDSLKAFFAAPVPAAIAVLLIVGIVGFFIWKNYPDRSEVLTALNKAYKNERPLKARISDFDYAPTKNTRGGEDKTDKIQSELAKSRALQAFPEKPQNPTAENHHALGRVYLTEKEFDKAIEQFEKALKLSPDDAKIHNDLGIALMEKAGIQTEGKLENLAKALEEFDKAIELNKTLPDAYFNRALCLQAQGFTSQARTAWQKYLQLDETSDWANEARKYLQETENQSAGEISGEQLETEFLNLYRERNDDAAWRLISQNRELISEKYLPQRLAMFFLNAPSEDRRERLEALKYLGQLEKTRTEDFFASDIADFYENASEDSLELSKKAQNAVRKGYRYFHEDNFSEALKEFNFAKDAFLQAGNVIEANSICLHFIGYIFYFTDKRKDGVQNFALVNEFCRQKKYKWLYLMNFIWLTGGRERLGETPTTEIKNEYEKALQESEAMGDSFMTQKYLLNLASRSSFVKQESSTFNYLQRLFAIASQSQISLRQRFRNYNTSIEMIPVERFTSLSKSLVLESVHLAETSKDILFLIDSQINAAIVHTKTGNFTEAENWLEKANRNIETVQEESQKKETRAKMFLKRGHLEREKNNYRSAVEFYHQASGILETTNTPPALYETKKSLLLAHQVLGNDAEVERQLSLTIKLAEDNRDIILDEQERHSFFDNEQTIYDIAIEHEIRKGEIAKAFDYAESSNSRSLLDWLQKGANIKTDKQKIEILLKEVAKPLSINEIREKMPSEVQLLQYTVLKGKILIWLVSKDKFVLVPSEVDSDKLEKTINNYLFLIQSKDQEQQNEAKILARGLFQILIAPILSQLDTNKEICLVPNKFLFHLPFSALISPNEDYFIERYNIFYAPSANVFLLCTENALTKTSFENETILSIGNPDFDKKEFPDLQDLPAAEKEAIEISGHYLSPKSLVGKQATRKAFLTDYKNYEIIHFAGHYAFQLDSPLHSKLILAKNTDNEPNFLTNADLMAEKLPKAKLVVLSACQTGVEGYYRSEGLIGLSRTFLATGVPLVVASQWQVDSDTTAIIMKKFHYYRRRQNLSTTGALRQAQIDFLKEQGETFQSPYYWAAFAAFGGYANF